MIKREAGGQLWMPFVYYEQNSISSFLLDAHCWADTDKARERERDRATGQHRRQQKAGKAWQCYSMCQGKKTPNYKYLHVEGILNPIKQLGFFLSCLH